MMWIALHTKFSMDNIINKSFLPNKKICLNLPDFPMIILGGERSLCTVHTGLHTAQGDELRGSKNEEIPAGIKCIPRAIHHLLCNTSSHRIWITFKIWISSLTFKSFCMIVSLTKRLMFQVLFFFIISCKILWKNPFNFFFNFTKIKINSFECPKSKPATHCFIFNLSK